MGSVRAQCGRLPLRAERAQRATARSLGSAPQRLVVTSVRTHPASSAAERGCQLHPTAGQACCCCGSLHPASVQPLRADLCILLARLIIDPSRCRVRCRSGSSPAAPSATARVWRLVYTIGAVDPRGCSQLGPPQGAVRGRTLCQAALFAPFRNGSAQGRYCTYTEVSFAVERHGLRELVPGEHPAI